ncbi:MAG TPA: helicase-related protein, partial [Capillimicrobium sp.]
TPKRELADILARYERGDIDVLVNAQLLAEGWNSPRATVCMHLAPTASKRIYQQRVGRVTRRHPGKESGVVVDFVHPATKHDDPVVTLHSLLDRDVYRGGAIVVGPVRRGRGRRIRVERRVLPVCADEERRAQVFERELWRIAVEHLDWGEQHVWAALAGARVQPSGWRRARAMLHFDKSGELKRRFLLTAVQRNKSSQLRVKALQEIAAAKDAEAFDLAIDEIGGWSREERREAVKVCLQALAEKRIGRRDQANAWIWRLAEYTMDVHEEYAVQRWPETKRLLGLLVNSSGGAHARNARRLVHATRKQDRRLSAALLAAAKAHTPEAEEVLRGARTRMARKPNSLARDLLRNFPKKRSRGRRKRKKDEASLPEEELLVTTEEGVELDDDELDEAVEAVEAAELDDEPDTVDEPEPADEPEPVDEQAAAAAIAEAAAAVAQARESKPRPRRRSRAKKPVEAEPPTDAQQVLIDPDGEGFGDAQVAEAEGPEPVEKPAPKKRPPRKRAPAKPKAAAEPVADEPVADEPGGEQPEAEVKKPVRRRSAKKAPAEAAPEAAAQTPGEAAPEPAEPEPPKKKPVRRRTTKKADPEPTA